MLFKTIRSNLTARRIVLVAAPLAVIGAAVSTASAADHGWWRSRGPTVVINARFPGPRVVERRVVCDEVPSGLQMSAYQSKDRVIVIISGTNRGGGFSTSLEADGRGYSPSLILHNTAPLDGCRESACSFSLTASVCSGRELRTICMRIGDRSFEIPVTCVPSLT
jgi:hypothetical protein